MPIAFTCSCGKEMKAKEAFAGRKIKCPQCETVVRIPRLDSDEDELSTTPLPVRRSPPFLARPVSAGGEKDGTHYSMAPPLARPVFANHKPATVERSDGPSVHAWIDRSLEQQATPWLPGDEERFQRGIKALREGWSGLEKGIIGLVLIGVATAVWFLLPT